MCAPALSNACTVAQVPARTTTPITTRPLAPPIARATTICGTVLSASLAGATTRMDTAPQIHQTRAARTIVKTMSRPGGDVTLAVYGVVKNANSNPTKSSRPASRLRTVTKEDDDVTSNIDGACPTPRSPKTAKP